MNDTTIERRYAMVRIGAGDWMLPSNDEQTMWRLAAYEEDGSAWHTDEQGREHKITGRYWSLYRMSMTKLQALVHSSFTSDDDILDWTEWEHWACGFGSRKAAIEEALHVGSR